MYLRLCSFSTNCKAIFKKQFWFRINQSTNDAIITLDEFFFLYIQLTRFMQKVYSHQVLTYLNVPGIPVKKPLQNR